MKDRYSLIEAILEVGIYLFIIFMFLTKGEGIRNILILGNFTLWLLTLKGRRDLYLLKNPVAILFWVYTGSILLSAIFSIDPSYSFLKLRNEPLKPLLLFPVIATVMSDNERLKRLVHVMFLMAVFIVIIGYYSYFFHNIDVLKPDTPLMHAWHNKFARYLNTLLPFSFILYFIWKNIGLRIFLTVSFIISVIALILSTSRGGYISFISMVCIWAVYISRERGFNLKKVFVSIILVTLLLGAISWFSFPPVRNRMAMFPQQLSTMNQRTQAWIPALYAFKERPLTGWGHGRRIFNQNESYKETPFDKAPSIGPENTFIKILFHQGLIGIIPYTFLIFLAIREFWKKAGKISGLSSYILVACVSVLVGNYIFHSMLAVLKLRYLAVVLGLGVAAFGIDEDSHN